MAELKDSMRGTDTVREPICSSSERIVFAQSQRTCGYDRQGNTLLFVCLSQTMILSPYSNWFLADCGHLQNSLAVCTSGEWYIINNIIYLRLPDEL